jgi:hypothetical protein
MRAFPFCPGLTYVPTRAIMLIIADMLTPYRKLLPLATITLMVNGCKGLSYLTYNCWTGFSTSTSNLDQKRPRAH